ncbi:hypothetical protein ORI20_28870 [Mycobacterium sp. CVI_P3]|uniref:Uncharacterized protein n=1 Tax=Mycobacterium pinniadriaticum TaxID=2994102 RepID=A0ABT3SND4_9MYCO|nr:hypothetical protein [Mycobacterium pinniadriaticum]MCX2934284.1 hypothetical protein [Mycobacterium pinniadriaticum]MCX2940678.1 hypothetical protein [Mycobacterium pinniadriaticum]
MKRATELACAWGGIAFSVLFFVGFVGIARFFPPLSPADTAEQTAAIYRDHASAIQTGLLVAYVGTMCFLAFGSGIVGQTRRIRGVAPAVTFFQVSSYASAVLLIILPLICWFTAAFRPETRSAESIQLINDFGWIGFVIGFPPFVTWVFSTGLAILSDESERPLYPRWSGYLSLCMGLLQVMALLLVFFKVGPFAWDGLFSWYIPFTDFFAWFVVITVLTIKAINNPGYEALADARSDQTPELALSRRAEA